MTHTTDQNRAEFEREMEAIFSHTDFELAPEGHYKNPITGTWLLIWQASRRTQVVPQGWELVPQKATDEMLQAAQKAWLADPLRSTTTLWVAMLAAAPQPPEAAQLDDINVADIAQAVDSKEEAPVQMPEPVAAQSRFTTPHGDLWKICTVEHARAFGQDDFYEVRYLYTEHQVRQLLADNGIGKDKA